MSITSNQEKPRVAGVVIKKNGKYLMVQEKKEIAYGLWNWPAGHINEGETFEEGAIREAKEETGYEVRLIRKIGVFDKKTANAHLFEAEIIGGTESFPDDEILALNWFSPAEIREMSNDLRSYWVLDALSMLEN